MGPSETAAVGNIHDNDNTLASISFTGAPIGNLSYNWDANKNKTSEGITGTMSGYGFDVGTSGYDDEDRLVGWQRDDNNLDQAWNLSLVGDWNSFTENASVQSRTHGPTHELLSVASQAVAHDAKGNQTSIPAVLRPGSSDPLAMKWDFENKLISADIDNDTFADVTYQWDALGRRVGRDDGTTATVFIQSGQQTVADYTSGTAAASPTYNYVYASYIDEPVMRTGTGGLRYYHRGQQYSVVAMTNGGGTITERYAYSAYGTPTITDASGTARTTSADNNRYTYTGREFDSELGLYHYRARMYDAVAGRFCSKDPIGFRSGSKCMYEYVGGHALVGVDPTGLCNPLTGEGCVSQPDPPVITVVHEAPCTEGNFMEWYRNELAELGGWAGNLQPCPCNIHCYQETKTYHCQNGKLIEYRNRRLAICSTAPPGFSYNNTFPVINWWGDYHPGGRYELRADNGTQCIYGSDGELITTPPTAGSGDRYPPFGTSIGEHREGDVAPYECARNLDAASNSNYFTQLYFQVRPQVLPCSGGSHTIPPIIYGTPARGTY